MGSNNYKLYLSIIGFLVICIIFWNRFLRNRLSKDFTLYNNFYYIFLICAVLITFVLLCINVYEIYKRVYGKKIFKNSIAIYFSKLKNKYSYIIEKVLKVFVSLAKSPKTFYDNIIFPHLNISHIVEVPSVSLARLLINQKEVFQIIAFNTIYIVLNTIPKILCSTVFLIDILFYKHLDNFYKVLFLLGIVLLYNVITSVIVDLCDKNTYYATAHIEIKPINNENEVIVFRKEIPAIIDAKNIIERKNDVELLKWFGYIWETYRDIKWIFYRLHLVKDNISPYENIIIYSMYLYGWSYILYFLSVTTQY